MSPLRLLFAPQPVSNSSKPAATRKGPAEAAEAPHAQWQRPQRSTVSASIRGLLGLTCIILCGSRRFNASLRLSVLFQESPFAEHIVSNLVAHRRAF